MIEDALFRTLKKKAANEGRTLQDVVNDLLRQALNARNGKKFRLNWKPLNGRLRPGVDICDRQKLFDLMDGR
jgi:hypothetical protein